MATDGEHWIKDDLADTLAHEIAHLADASPENDFASSYRQEDFAMDVATIFRMQRSDRNPDEPLLIQGDHGSNRTVRQVANMSPTEMAALQRVNALWESRFGGMPIEEEVYRRIEENSFEAVIERYGQEQEHDTGQEQITVTFDDIDVSFDNLCIPATPDCPRTNNTRNI